MGDSDFSVTFFSVFIQHKVVDGTFQTSSGGLYRRGKWAPVTFPPLFPVKNTKVFRVGLVQKSNSQRAPWDFMHIFVCPNRNTVSRDVWVVVNSVNLASISANSASSALTSADRVCMAAIYHRHFPLLRLAWAISAETVSYACLEVSTLTKMSRRLASISSSFKIAASTIHV